MERILRALYSISVATSFSAALYSTIIFSMLGLYGHSALGMGNDAGYSEFVKATSFIRVSGFRKNTLGSGRSQHGRFCPWPVPRELYNSNCE
eukprot:scaffold2983_cov123-Cylindrotheca_fusiformis.AAC.6